VISSSLTWIQIRSSQIQTYNSLIGGKTMKTKLEPIQSSLLCAVTLPWLASRSRRRRRKSLDRSANAGMMIYHGAQVRLEHRYSSGLYLLNAFSYSRTIDNASGHLDTPNNDNSRVKPWRSQTRARPGTRSGSGEEGFAAATALESVPK